MDEFNNIQEYCKYCGEEIAHDTRRCPFCGSLLNAVPNKINTFSYKKTDENTDVITDENTDVINTEFKFQQEQNWNKNDYWNQNGNNNNLRKGSSTENLGNGLKVFLTIIATIIPGIGQLLGVIIGIILMNTDDNPDKKSFGLALLVASLIFFVISFLFFVAIVMVINASNYWY